jgi:hypothetical protein
MGGIELARACRPITVSVLVAMMMMMSAHAAYAACSVTNVRFGTNKVRRLR